MKSTCFVIIGLLLSACGPKAAEPRDQPTAEPTTAPATDTSGPIAEPLSEVSASFTSPLTPPPKPWHDLSEDEQKAHMKNVIMPAMKERFQAYDATEFAKFTCATCHGPNAHDVNFKMPNPGLTKLPHSEEAFGPFAAKHPKAVEFMMKTVLPDMATMLGEKPFDPAVGKGFSCMNCHTPES